MGVVGLLFVVQHAALPATELLQAIRLLSRIHPLNVVVREGAVGIAPVVHEQEFPLTLAGSNLSQQDVPGEHQEAQTWADRRGS